MKIRFYILVGFLSLSFASCKLEGRNEASPQLHLSNQGGIIKNDTDSLRLYIDPGKTAYLLDTVKVGDTVLFKLIILGGFHEIKQMNLNLSDSTLADLIYQPKDSLDLIFLEKSEYDKGLFLMDGTKNQFYFPFRLYAKKESKDLLLKISVFTTASQMYNNESVQIKIPIKP